ncbi:MAG: uroporphyrinogen decarboxylase family protein [Bacillota bacterium]|nr:uroporphyrinogen decarboxylase family protein [Bacillota bacterium]
MKLKEDTLKLFADVENRIDPDCEDDFRNQWIQFLENRFEGNIFTTHRNKKTAPSFVHEAININDAMESYELMLASQLMGVSHILSTDNQLISVRSNYGSGIMSSLFGAEIFLMPYEMNTLPTTRIFDDNDRIRKISEGGIPNIEGGFGKRTFEMGELFLEVFDKYPKIKKYVPVYHPDLQGPIDIAELMWGSEMFYAMYDEPSLVHRLLRVITDTYKAFLDKWFKMFPPSEDFNVHWSTVMHRGKILLRDDSAMNLSDELYREFAYPYDNELLEYYGGGVIHFCGRGDHYIASMSRSPKLYGINMTQPELNDMETIYRSTVDKNIKIMGFSRKWAEECSRDFHGQMHCL